MIRTIRKTIARILSWMIDKVDPLYGMVHYLPPALRLPKANGKKPPPPEDPGSLFEGIEDDRLPKVEKTSAEKARDEMFKDRDLLARTDRWIEENPGVFQLFEQFAVRLAARGRRFGIGALTERVRWEWSIEYNRDDFKINNNFRAYIIRRIIESHPEVGDFVELRRTRCWSEEE
jgi:hypothetical protein